MIVIWRSFPLPWTVASTASFYGLTPPKPEFGESVMDLRSLLPLFSSTCLWTDLDWRFADTSYLTLHPTLVIGLSLGPYIHCLLLDSSVPPFSLPPFLMVVPVEIPSPFPLFVVGPLLSTIRPAFPWTTCQDCSCQASYGHLACSTKTLFFSLLYNFTARVQFPNLFPNRERPIWFFETTLSDQRVNFSPPFTFLFFSGKKRTAAVLRRPLRSSAIFLSHLQNSFCFWVVLLLPFGLSVGLMFPFPLGVCLWWLLLLLPGGFFDVWGLFLGSVFGFLVGGLCSCVLFVFCGLVLLFGCFVFFFFCFFFFYFCLCFFFFFFFSAAHSTVRVTNLSHEAPVLFFPPHKKLTSKSFPNQCPHSVSPPIPQMI